MAWEFRWCSYEGVWGWLKLPRLVGNEPEKNGWKYDGVTVFFHHCPMHTLARRV